MLNSWVPRILHPEYTWPCPMRLPLSQSTPLLPRIPGPLERRIWGKIHTILCYFSEFYCRWFDIPFYADNVIQLPFGLLMKWTERTSIEEAMAMQIVRASGIPAPKLISCGEHPGNFQRFSILMTRLPGITLVNTDDPLDAENEEPWLLELKECLHSIRSWQSPYGSRICSVINTSIKSSRVPNHVMGPFENEQALCDFLLEPASSHSFKSQAEYEETLVRAKRINHRPHKITFTHGDLKAHNIMVDYDGHLSGFIDWESAGWCPEFWEFTTAMRFGQGSYWYQVASWLGGDQFLEELASDKAINNVTVDSYIGF